MSGELKVEGLTWQASQALAPRIREADAKECKANGRTPAQALAAATLFGTSFCVRRKDGTYIGAFGFSSETGAIWSLWSDEVDHADSRKILRFTPLWVRLLHSASGCARLWNEVDVTNKAALRWLRASRMFVIEEDLLLQRGGSNFFHFYTDGQHV